MHNGNGKSPNQIEHILVDRRRHSNVLDVRSYRAADCDTGHCLVVAKVRERLAVNKQRDNKATSNGSCPLHQRDTPASSINSFIK
jgi:hypothetical protein